MSEGSSWNGPKNKALGWTASNPESPSRTLISRATTARLGVNSSRYIFETIEEAQDQATEWLWTYNNERPNMGIGGMTPRYEPENGRMSSTADPH